MALTPSTMQLSLGADAPDFALPDPDGKIHSLGDFAGRPALLVAFICNHCPYVKHIAPAFAQLAKEYQEQGRSGRRHQFQRFRALPRRFAGEDERRDRAARATRFPYLVDQSQQVAKAYRGRMHARLLSLRRRSEAGLSRPDGRQPSRQQPARHRQGPPRRAGRRPGRPARAEGAAAQHRMQHQVASRGTNPAISGNTCRTGSKLFVSLAAIVFRGRLQTGSERLLAFPMSKQYGCRLGSLFGNLRGARVLTYP